MSPVGAKPIGEAIGWNMRAARIEAGLTQKELGIAIGASRCSVGRWEAECYDGGVDVLLKAHRALGVPLWGLVPTPEETEELMEENEAWKQASSLEGKSSRRG